MDDFTTIRADFPMLKQQMNGHPLIYFDTGATAQKPQVVIDTIKNFYENHYGTVHRAIYQLAVHSTKAYDHSRQVVKQFINASTNEEIIFTKGTTEAINLVASTFGSANLAQGDEIIITYLEHHSNIVPWQLLCQRTGAILKAIPINDKGELLLDAYRSLLSPRTKMVCIGHIANSIGTVNPIKTIIQLAHAVGAKVLVDAAQSAPHIQIDVQDLDVDFLAFSGHKIYGPTGVGILFGKKELLESMPPYQGGGDMIDLVTIEKTTYAKAPAKFEAGTPMIAEVIGLAAAIEYLTKIGLDKIHAHEKQLLDHATLQLNAIDDVKIIGQAANKGGIISFVVDGIHALDLGTFFDLKGVALRTGHHCAQPALARFNVPSTCRISFGLYNTIDEIDRFIPILKEAIRVLKS
jgi:cysteine desulfurase / selenocysteine lyase